MSQNPQTLKIILIGDSGVGKTSLIYRYIQDIFNVNLLTTIKVDFQVKEINIDSNIVKLQVWDTAGQERFRSINAAYYRGADGVLIVFDVTKESSFANVQSWLNDFKEHSNKHSSIILIGNKIDLTDHRRVSIEQAQNLADEIGIRYFEASAMNGENVDASFSYLATEIYRNDLNKKITQKEDKNAEVVKITKTSTQDGKNCC